MSKRFVQVWIGLVPNEAPGLEGESGLCMQVEEAVKAVGVGTETEVATMVGSDVLQSDLAVGEATWQIPVLVVVSPETSKTIEIERIRDAVGTTVAAFRDVHLPLRGKVNVLTMRADSLASF